MSQIAPVSSSPTVQSAPIPSTASSTPAATAPKDPSLTPAATVEISAKAAAMHADADNDGD